MWATEGKTKSLGKARRYIKMEACIKDNLRQILKMDMELFTKIAARDVEKHRNGRKVS